MAQAFGIGRYSLYLLLAGLIILLDQITKALIHAQMLLHESIEIIPEFFSLTYIRNPGAAFGLFVNTGAQFRLLFFLSVTTIAILVICYLFFKTVQEGRELQGTTGHRTLWAIRIGLTLVLGGAIGYLIDRVRYGEVIDFLDFYIGRYHWPAFNVADSSITVGVSLLLLATFFPRAATQPAEPPTPDSTVTPPS